MHPGYIYICIYSTKKLIERNAEYQQKENTDPYE